MTKRESSRHAVRYASIQWVAIVTLTFAFTSTATARLTQDQIQQLIDAKSAAGGGVVDLPQGVTELDTAGRHWCLRLRDNVTLRGHEQGTVLKLKQQPRDKEFVYMLLVGDPSEPVSNVRLESLTIDGNHPGGYEAEHRNGVFMNHCSDVTIKDVEARGHSGDGFQIYRNTKRIRIQDCYVHDTGRAGVSLTGFGEDITIDSVRFENVAVQSIDTEPNDEGRFNQIRIENCDIKTHVGKDICVTVVRGDDWVLSNCRIQGTVNVLRCDRVLITGCHIYDGTDGAVYLNYDSKNTMITDCFLSNAPSARESVIYAKVSNDQRNVGLSVCNNHIVAKSQHGLILWGCHDVTVINNQIHAQKMEAIHLRATGTVRNHLIANNLIRCDQSEAIYVFGSEHHEVSGLLIKDNLLAGPKPIIRFDGMWNGYRFSDVDVKDNLRAMVVDPPDSGVADEPR